MNKQLFAKLALIAAMGAIGTFAASANAATATASFQVLMTIQKSCSVTAGTASNISLGTVASTATPNNGSNTISVTCSKTTPYNIGMLPSAANSGTANGTGNMTTADALAGNTDKVPYTLYSNSGYTTVWGNTIGTNTVTSTGTGLAQSFTVYAQNVNANFTPDSYADTVGVTVTY
ncbi:MAG: spore coat U domain-containing protein [Rhodoferax sp.]|nr:spore coat U domain-containing protein [Rhodoferax sp.]